MLCPSMSQPSPTTPYSKAALIAGLLLIMAITVVLRVRLMDIPLNRDEGGYAYAGQLILQGAPPYRDAIHIGPPGIPAMYAAFQAVFGQTARAIRLGLLVVNLCTIWLVYLIARRWFDPLSGVLAAAFYSLLSISPSVLGFAAQPAHFIVLPALAGIAVLMGGQTSMTPHRVALTGLFFGFAVLMEPSALWWGVFGWVYVLRHGPTASRWGWFLTGFFVPSVLTCVLLWRAGVFEDFWFWTVTYVPVYATDGWNNLLENLGRVIRPNRYIWLLAGVGAAALAMYRRWQPRWTWLAGLLIVSLIGILPGFHFRADDFILLLPVVALAAGAGIGALYRYFEESTGRARYAAAILLLPGLALAHTVNEHRSFLFTAPPRELARRIYGINPYAESVEIARYLREHTDAASHIAVLGSEPQIYFHAGRTSATAHIRTHALMEPHRHARRMQQELIADIEERRPEHLIIVNIPSSWRVGEHSDIWLFPQVERLIRDHHELTGIVDISPFTESQYRWDEEAHGQQPQSPLNLLIYRRVEAGNDRTNR